LRNANKAGLPERIVEPAAIEALMRHDWPGNIRELENVVLRLVAIHAQETISADLVAAQLSDNNTTLGAALDLADQPLAALTEGWLRGEFSRHGSELPSPGLYDRVLREVEAPLLRAALVATHGNQLRAAELLGVNRNTLRKKMRVLGIQVHAEIA
jgi:two-component system, NtrC family, nitrogen regulation response regulator GlnG